MTDRHPTFVDFETARATPGLRLVTVAGVPSLWSEAAKAIFQIKQIPFVAVRLTIQDTEIRGWTGVNNAPVAMYDDEPPRSGWRSWSSPSGWPPLHPFSPMAPSTARECSTWPTTSAERWESAGARVSS